MFLGIPFDYFDPADDSCCCCFVRYCTRFSLTLIISVITLDSMVILIISLSLLMVPIVSLILVLVSVVLLTICSILVGIILCIVASPCFMLVLKENLFVLVCLLFIVSSLKSFLHYIQCSPSLDDIFALSIFTVSFTQLSCN